MHTLLKGHQPVVFKGQRGKILRLLEESQSQWVPAYRLAGIALQYNARVKELRDHGYVIENKTERVGGAVHGSFRLVSAPQEHTETGDNG
jgi:hypothetical protein